MTEGSRPLLLTVGRVGYGWLEAAFEVFSARNGEQATTLFAKLQPAAVILESSPDNAALCEKLHALPGGTDAAIVILGEADDAAGERATDVIALPLIENRVILRIRHLLRSASELKSARESARRLGRAQRLARLAQWELACETGRFRWSDEVTTIFGIPTEAPEGGVTAILRFVHPEDRMRVARALLEPGPHSIEYRLVLPGNRVLTIHQEAEVIEDDGNAIQMIGTAQDVTELRDAERQVVELAYFDSLTRLPNRALLRKYMERTAAAATVAVKPLAVLAIDLDGFKRVNDTLGHAGGDILLREVATRLTASVRGARACRDVEDGMLERQLHADALVARLGGDEFVVVLTDLSSSELAATVARRIIDAISGSFSIGGTEVFISSSIGIACLPDNGTNVSDLLEHADTAMYHAKESGRSNYQFFTAGLHDRARRRMVIESALRGALDRAGITGRPKPNKPNGQCELSLAFQPKIEIPIGDMVGVEALLRWTSPELGFVSPAEFIPIAEDTGLIVPLGEWVLREACLAARRWLDRGDTPLRVAVNVSARQFREADFPARVRKILDETGACASLLELEITEGLVMQDTAASMRTLDELKSFGLRIALDDFGTGYSSLGYLSRLPIDAVKIDRSFVSALGESGKGETITSAIIALSRGLQVDVVIEGVETQAQLDFLSHHGRAEIQGFLFAKPMPYADLESWQQKHRASHPRPMPSDQDGESGVFHAAPKKKAANE